jgi:outer membrane lipoprotein-sorting protein
MSKVANPEVTGILHLEPILRGTGSSFRMLIGVCLLTMSFAATNPIADAMDSYKNINAYSVTLRSKSENTSETIKYFYKKPGFVRMEFIEPHSGALLVYDPAKKLVTLRPFSSLKSFVLTLKPNDFLVRSSNGHTVAESDIGALLIRVSELQKKGSTDVLGDEDIAGRKTMIVSVAGKKGVSVDGTHKYLLWLEKGSSMPLRVKAYDTGDKLSEDVLMDDLRINPELPENYFEIQ